MDSTEQKENDNHDSETIRLELEEARTRIDLYEFQIANLRSDLEQIKMHAVLTNLGGAPQFMPSNENMYSEPLRGVPPSTETPDENIDSRGMRRNLDTAVKTVAAIDQQLQNAQKRIAELETDLNNQQQKISKEHTEVIRQLEDEIKEKEGRLQSLAPVADARLESEKQLQCRIKELEEEILKKDIEIAEHKQNFETQTASIAQELEMRLQQLEVQIKEKEAGILAEKQEIEASADTRIDELSRKITELECDIEARGLRITELESLLEEIRHDSDTESNAKLIEFKQEAARERDARNALHRESEERIESQKREYEEKIQKLADEISEKDNHIAGLSRDRDDARTAVNEDHFLKREYLDLQQQLLESQKQTNDATQQIQALNMEIESKTETENMLRQLEVRLEESEKQYRALLEKHETLKKENEELELVCRDGEQQSRDIHDEHSLELRNIREDYEKRLTHHTERLQGEYLEIRQMIQQRENGMERLREQIAALSAENKSLSAENRELIVELASEKQKVEEYVKQSYDDVKQKMLDQFIANPSPAVLIELRQLFLKTRRYLDAVRTFRQVLVDPRNQKYTPAVCLLVGEFYKLAGRADDASFYLANPLIKEDSYAQYLFRKIASEKSREQPSN